MKRSAAIILAASYLTGTLTGCSVAERQCKQWRNDGLMYSTIESCSRCYQQYPLPQLEVVAGCALGLDAAELINTPQVRPQ